MKVSKDKLDEYYKYKLDNELIKKDKIIDEKDKIIDTLALIMKKTLLIIKGKIPHIVITNEFKGRKYEIDGDTYKEIIDTLTGQIPAEITDFDIMYRPYNNEIEKLIDNIQGVENNE